MVNTWIYRCGLEVTHSWVGNLSRRLHLDYTLDEFDAAQSHTSRLIIHAAEDVRFDRSHLLPGRGIIGVGYARITCKNKFNRCICE